MVFGCVPLNRKPMDPYVRQHTLDPRPEGKASAAAALSAAL
jgi:hypothetical protein